MKLLIHSLLAILLFSCNDSSTPAEQIRQLNQSDTFYHEINKVEWMSDSAYFESRKQYQNALGLENLEKGFDSIQIRIDYGGRIVILTNKDDKWGAEIISIVYKDSAKVIKDYKSPKTGWEEFIAKLFNLDILTLPDQHNIKGFENEIKAGDFAVSVEIATNKVNREYLMSIRNSSIDKSEEMKKLNQILKLVDEELGLEKLWDYMNELPPSYQTPERPKTQEIDLRDIKQDSAKN